MRTKTELAVLPTPPFAEVEAALAACQGELAGLVFRKAEIEADVVHMLSSTNTKFSAWIGTPIQELSGCQAAYGLCTGCRSDCQVSRERARVSMRAMELTRPITVLKITLNEVHIQLGQLAWYARQRKHGKPDSWRTEPARHCTRYYKQYATPDATQIVLSIARGNG